MAALKATNRLWDDFAEANGESEASSDKPKTGYMKVSRQSIQWVPLAYEAQIGVTDKNNPNIDIETDLLFHHYFPIKGKSGSAYSSIDGLACKSHFPEFELLALWALFFGESDKTLCPLCFPIETAWIFTCVVEPPKLKSGSRKETANIFSFLCGSEADARILNVTAKDAVSRRAEMVKDRAFFGNDPKYLAQLIGLDDVLAAEAVKLPAFHFNLNDPGDPKFKWLDEGLERHRAQGENNRFKGVLAKPLRCIVPDVFAQTLDIRADKRFGDVMKDTYERHLLSWLKPLGEGAFGAVHLAMLVNEKMSEADAEKGCQDEDEVDDAATDLLPRAAVKMLKSGKGDIYDLDDAAYMITALPPNQDFLEDVIGELAASAMVIGSETTGYAPTARTTEQGVTIKELMKHLDVDGRLSLALKKDVDPSQNALEAELKQMVQAHLLLEVPAEDQSPLRYRLMPQEKMDTGLKTDRVLRDFLKEKKAFQAEVDVMKLFESPGAHRNVCHMLGAAMSERPWLLVLEHCELGDLASLLQDQREKKVDVKPYQAAIALQIAEGMEHVGSRSVVHRDLAARNVLVARREEEGVMTLVMKVADFGLAKITENGEYNASTRDPFPRRWTAPEGFTNFPDRNPRGKQKFSSASDVWSFGMTLWEVAQYATLHPYPDVSHTMNLGKVLARGKVPQQPKNKCSPEFYAVAKLCWSLEPSDRPTFKDLVSKLERQQLNVRKGFVHSAVAAYIHPKFENPETSEADYASVPQPKGKGLSVGDLIGTVLQVDGVLPGTYEEVPPTDKELQQRLFQFAKEGEVDKLKALADHIDVDLADEHGVYPLFYACKFGHRDTVMYLLERQPVTAVRKNEKNGQQIIHYMMQADQFDEGAEHLEILEHMVDTGVDFNIAAVDDKGKNAVHYLIANDNASFDVEMIDGNLDAVDGLLTVKVPAQDRKDSRLLRYLNDQDPITAVHGNLGDMGEEDSDVYLYGPGVKGQIRMINAKDRKGKTPVHVTCVKETLHAYNKLQALLKLGAVRHTSMKVKSRKSEDPYSALDGQLIQDEDEDMYAERHFNGAYGCAADVYEDLADEILQSRYTDSQEHSQHADRELYYGNASAIAEAGRDRHAMKEAEARRGNLDPSLHPVDDKHDGASQSYMDVAQHEDDIDERMDARRTMQPIHAAAQNGRADLVQLLVEPHQNRNKEGNLIMAPKDFKRQIKNILKEDSVGNTAAHYAALNGHRRVIETLHQLAQGCFRDDILKARERLPGTQRMVEVPYHFKEILSELGASEDPLSIFKKENASGKTPIGLALFPAGLKNDVHQDGMPHVAVLAKMCALGLVQQKTFESRNVDPREQHRDELHRGAARRTGFHLAKVITDWYRKHPIGTLDPVIREGLLIQECFTGSGSFLIMCELAIDIKRLEAIDTTNFQTYQLAHQQVQGLVASALRQQGSDKKAAYALRWLILEQTLSRSVDTSYRQSTDTLLAIMIKAQNKTAVASPAVQAVVNELWLGEKGKSTYWWTCLLYLHVYWMVRPFAKLAGVKNSSLFGKQSPWNTYSDPRMKFALAKELEVVFLVLIASSSIQSSQNSGAPSATEVMVMLWILCYVVDEVMQFQNFLKQHGLTLFEVAMSTTTQKQKRPANQFVTKRDFFNFW